MLNQKFLNFLESVKTPENTNLVNSIMEAYETVNVLEEGIMSKTLGTLGLIVGMLSSGASADEINWKKELTNLNKELTTYVEQFGFTTELGNQMAQATKVIREKVADQDKQEKLVEILAKMQDKLLDKSSDAMGDTSKPSAVDQEKLRSRIHTLGNPKVN